MTTSDPAVLLRQAADILRTHANRLPEQWRTQPWRVVQTDTEHDDGIAACDQDHADDPRGAHDCCWSSESTGHRAVAAYAVLMRPPVALALADLLGETADLIGRPKNWVWPIGIDRAAIAVAQAIVDSTEAS